jgi:hypothetical protein
MEEGEDVLLERQYGVVRVGARRYSPVSRFPSEFRYSGETDSPPWRQTMTPRSLTPVLLVCAALGVACDNGFEPTPPVLSSLVLTPDFAEFVGPGNTVQLTFEALDQRGAPMPGADAITYSSSAPAVAEVSSSGVVTAATPGSAEITAALTLGGATRTASMTVRVHAPDYLGIGGVYDLAALITSFDPAWGEHLEGYRYTAVLTLVEAYGGRPWFRGTYADLRLIGPGGDSYPVTDTGVVTGSIDPDGRVVMELVGDGDHIGLTLIVATVDPWGSVIDGSFGCCGHIGGTFTVQRREEW